MSERNEQQQPAGAGGPDLLSRHGLSGSFGASGAGQWRDLRTLVFDTHNRPATLVALAASVGLAVSETLGIATLYPLLVFLDKGREGLLEAVPMSAELDELLVATFGVSINVPILASIILIAFALRQALNYVRSVTVAKVGIETTRRFRSYFFSRKVTANTIRDVSSGKNESMPFLMEDCFRAGQFAQNGLDFVTYSVPLILFACALVYLAAVPTLVLAIIGGLIALTYRRRMKLGETLGQELSQQQTQLYWFIDEFISNLRLLRLRNYEREASERVDGRLDRLAEVNLTLIRQRQMMEASSQFLMFAGIILGFIVLVSYLGGDVAQTGVFAVLCLRSLPYASTVNGIRFDLRYTHQSLARVRAFEERIGPAESGGQSGRQLRELAERIELRNVEFSYPRTTVQSAADEGPGAKDAPAAEPEAVTLKDIDLEVRKGEILALVGKSGAGKSTIADLLGTLSHADVGEVLYDDAGLETLDVASVRRRIAYVPQSPVLFDDTIRANLLFAASEVPTEEALTSVLERCGCQFVHELPGGLDAKVGYRGDRLSGGQRQRIAIARELLRHPDVIIMDEPTSALDGQSETFLIEELNRIKAEAAIILIAHRITSIRYADRIAVIEAGRIRRIGTAEEVRGDAAFGALFGADPAPAAGEAKDEGGGRA